MLEIKNPRQVMKVLEWMQRQKDYVEIYYLGGTRLNESQISQLEKAIKKETMMPGIPEFKVQINDDGFTFGLTENMGYVLIPEGSVKNIGYGTYELIKNHICTLLFKK